MNEVYAALAKVQAELPGLKKSATNPHFKSKYIPLDAIHEAVDPLLAKHGLIWTACPSFYPGDNSPALSYRLIHVESGEDFGGTMPLLLDKQNSQGLGSAITYARRYALSSVLGIIADEDDDGNKASATTARQKATVAGVAADKTESFVDKVKATGKKAAEIREWALASDYLPEEVGTTPSDLRKFLEGLGEIEQAALLMWASA